MGGEIKMGCVLIFKEDVFADFEKPIFSHQEIHKVEVVGMWYNEKYKELQYRFIVLQSSCREEGDYFSKIHRNVVKNEYRVISDLKNERKRPEKMKTKCFDENRMLQAEARMIRSFWARKSK